MNEPSEKRVVVTVDGRVVLDMMMPASAFAAPAAAGGGSQPQQPRDSQGDQD